MPPLRRLTTILAADVAGYSRLMGADEEGTDERLKVRLGELINPKIGDSRKCICAQLYNSKFANGKSAVYLEKTFARKPWT